MSSVAGRIRTLALVAIVALAVLPSWASAQVVYDNGVPDNSDGLPVTALAYFADDFTLGTSATLNSFTWYALDLRQDGAATRTASFSWWILSDAGGRPGAVVASGDAVGVTGDKTSYYCCGSQFVYTDYVYTANIGSVPLGSGAYWLSIGNFADDQRYGAYWATSTQTGGNSYYSTDFGATYNRYLYPKDLAFSLSADVVSTPEPASVALLATGLVGVVAIRRRKTRA